MSLLMSIVIVLAVPLIAGLFFNIILKPRTFLDSLEWQPGESVLFEDVVKVRSFLRGNRSVGFARYPGSKVVVTNKRILLCQKILFQKRYMVIWAFNYTTNGPALTAGDLMGGMIFKIKGTGFPTVFIKKQNVIYTTVKNVPVVRIELPFSGGSPLFGQPWFEIYTANTAKYNEIFS